MDRMTPFQPLTNGVFYFICADILNTEILIYCILEVTLLVTGIFINLWHKDCQVVVEKN